MSKTPKRKRFQIHLSTAVIVMFVAGGMLWVNAPITYGDPHGYYIKAYGWPRMAAVNVNVEMPWTDTEYTVWAGSTAILCFSLVLDLMLAILAVLAAWFLCESLIRRRPARNET